VKPQNIFYTYYSVVTLASDGWGETEWGLSPWGDSQFSVSPIIRIRIPTQFQRAPALTLMYRHKTAKEKFSLLSVALSCRLLSDRTTLIPRSSTT
jgi:hypothetical protein